MSITCWAPREAYPCDGNVTVEQDVPLCKGHGQHLVNGTGPWTAGGAREWWTAMSAVYAAHAHEKAALAYFTPEGDGHGPFKWIGGSPGWDSNDSFSRYGFEYFKENGTGIAVSKKPRKNTEEKRWNPNAWYTRFNKKKKAGR